MLRTFNTQRTYTFISAFQKWLYWSALGWTIALVFALAFAQPTHIVMSYCDTTEIASCT